jgi:hypothetical protein
MDFQKRKRKRKRKKKKTIEEGGHLTSQRLVE